MKQKPVMKLTNVKPRYEAMTGKDAVLYNMLNFYFFLLNIKNHM